MLTQAATDPLENLELLAAACILARQIYEARGEAFGLSGIWTMLNASERQAFINQAVGILQSVAPPMGSVIAFEKKL